MLLNFFTLHRYALGFAALNRMLYLRYKFYMEHIISPPCRSQSEQNDKTPFSGGFKLCRMPSFHIYSKTQSFDCRLWSTGIRLKQSPRYRFTDTNSCLGCCPDRQPYLTASNAGLTDYLIGPYFFSTHRKH